MTDCSEKGNESTEKRVRLSRIRCQEILKDLDDDHVRGKNWSFDGPDDPKGKLDCLHLKYLRDHGLLTLSFFQKGHANPSAFFPVIEQKADMYKAVITSSGISTCEIARKTGKPPKIDEADEISTGWSRIKRYLLMCTDEFVKAIIRTLVPAFLAGIGAGLSFGWFSKLIH